MRSLLPCFVIIVVVSFSIVDGFANIGHRGDVRPPPLATISEEHFPKPRRGDVRPPPLATISEEHFPKPRRGDKRVPLATISEEHNGEKGSVPHHSLKRAVFGGR